MLIHPRCSYSSVTSCHLPYLRGGVVIIFVAPVGDFGHLLALLVGEGLVGVEDLVSDEGGFVVDLEDGEEVLEEVVLGLVEEELELDSPALVVVVVAFDVHYFLFVLSSLHDSLEGVAKKYGYFFGKSLAKNPSAWLIYKFTNS